MVRPVDKAERLQGHERGTHLLLSHVQPATNRVVEVNGQFFHRRWAGKSHEPST